MPSARTSRAPASISVSIARSPPSAILLSAADRDLFVGLQLTHSGRFARPHAKHRPEPLAAYAHPLLDRRFAAGVTVLTDSDLGRLVDCFVRAARWAWDAGFAFVDIKHCH